MKTKIVYVLTCAPLDTYIEQALMSVWSARYHNPDAQIVLIVDDNTDELLIGNRSEITKYISEKIVIPFDAEKTPLYRSRWLKTSVRDIIKGDYLFIDCDTIITRDLSLIEQTEAEIAMVRDDNLDINQHSCSASRYMISRCALIGVDILKEQYYFNSGVMYVRDTTMTHALCNLWHTYWLEGQGRGIDADQPAFAKANIVMNRPVVLLDDKWNTILQSHIKEVYEGAYILHFWHTYSFLFSERVLSYVKENGLTDFIKYYVLHPTEAFIPHDNHIYYYKWRDYRRFHKILRKTLKEYADNIDAKFADFKIKMFGAHYIAWLLRHKAYNMASILIVLSKIYRVKISSNYTHYTNFFAKPVNEK